ncbi:hypothetical protein TNCV_3829561 [Trichonephila clavipes]|nr:hypothetical protein TNCV_3829561 [Trichonephila clavipes]
MAELNPNVIHRRLQQFLTTDIWHPGGSTKDGQGLSRVSMMTDICHYAHERKNKTAILDAFRSSLAASSRKLVSRSTACQKLHKHGLYAR